MSTSLWCHAIARMRTVETVWAVTPIVSQTKSLDICRHILIVEGHHRQQFHVGDTKLLEVRDFLYQPKEFARISYAGRWMLREPANVQLVDDRAVQTRQNRRFRR